MPSELQMTQRVRISDCDARARWRMSSILVQMQEMAEVHAASFGLPRKRLVDSGMAWILYRQHIVIHAYPTFDEDIRFTTWPGAVEGPIFPRHFIMEREDGERVAEATTSWILMDIHTRRPMRPSALPGKVEVNAERSAPLPLPGMLRVTDATPLLERKVCYSDLDVNGHMNNTRYVDWICDAMDVRTITDRGLAQLQINYISEARPAETLVLCAKEEGESTLILGKRAEDDKPVFEASISYMRP